jgi:hypothetical protein
MNNVSIEQSAINLQPPIKVKVFHTNWLGRKTGSISVGEFCELSFNNVSDNELNGIFTSIKLAYNVGFADASTHFLNNASKCQTTPT